jgi:CubicO group peptidase (beta-lactamase class C family)
MKKVTLLSIFALLLLVTGCQQEAGTQVELKPLASQSVVESLEPLLSGPRDKVTAAELTEPRYQGDGPLHNTYLSPMDGSFRANHTLEGTLTIPDFEMQYSNDFSRPAQAYFPAVSLNFFTHEDYLVPAFRDIIRNENDRSFWNLIVSPGKVWSEPGDSDMSRASFPFVLTSDQTHETHNGVATFLFNDATVSSLYLQVTQETAAWHKTDFWGQTPITYKPGRLDHRQGLAEAFSEELNRQTPIRPWSELEDSYDADLLAMFVGENVLEEISATGLIQDGAIYLQSCYTRYGPFPYCRYMRHGVFSVTKSMGAAVAMLRLAQKYGPEVFDLKIADYVEVTALHDGWGDVTFGDALNMATGIGDHLPERIEPNVMHGDEDERKFTMFMRAPTAEEKLDIAFSYGNYPWGPGEVARYSSTDTFILSAAMDGFLKSKEGPEANIWDMVVEEVYKPIGLQHAPIMRTVESDGSRGLPIFGYGLFPTVDDVAKVATLLQDGGLYQGQQLLHPKKLAEALYRTGIPGFPTGERNEYGQGRYLSSFWGEPYYDEEGNDFMIPSMLGFGGNQVVLNPNGITTFRFADSHIYDTLPLIWVADGIEPFSQRDEQ